MTRDQRSGPWPLQPAPRRPDLDPPTVRNLPLPRGDRPATPNRDLVVRQMRRRPVRGAIAVRLVSMFATVPAWEVAAGHADERAQRATRWSEWLLGVPYGTTRAALLEPAAPEPTR